MCCTCISASKLNVSKMICLYSASILPRRTAPACRWGTSAAPRDTGQCRARGTRGCRPAARQHAHGLPAAAGERGEAIDLAPWDRDDPASSPAEYARHGSACTSFPPCLAAPACPAPPPPPVPCSGSCACGAPSSAPSWHARRVTRRAPWTTRSARAATRTAMTRIALSLRKVKASAAGGDRASETSPVVPKAGSPPGPAAAGGAAWSSAAGLPWSGG
ncbi:hypothetical protein PAHAL_3G253900 [Panicum hallii]|jgi:hypothetical protein|uniref:Uncharacterized protein n=1 Tax=Panicum hallii TaxID=206008 RepID=A0A2S3HBH4_9POAL|nr:hypothetical protein PAHAL_3G253900 [Panicum hallii]